MRIIALGDTHRQHWNVQVPEGDVLLFAGDGEFRTPSDLIDFNKWLATLPHACKIVIAGNHDFFCERYPNEVKKYLTQAVYLMDESFVLPNRMILWGSPMTTTFGNWAFMESEENLSKVWSKIPEKASILLVHSPAYEFLDLAYPGGDHLGSKTLAKKISELGIPYVIHGHIHGGYGTKKTKATMYINCSVLNEEYELVNQSVVIDV